MSIKGGDWGERSEPWYGRDRRDFSGGEASRASGGSGERSGAS